MMCRCLSSNIDAFTFICKRNISESRAETIDIQQTRWDFSKKEINPDPKFSQSSWPRNVLRRLVKGFYPIQSLSRAHGPGMCVEMDNNFDWQPLTLKKWKRLLPKSGGPLGACALSRSTLSHIFYSQFHSKIRQVLLGVNLKPFWQQSKLTIVKTQKSIGRVFWGKETLVTTRPVARVHS